MKPGLLPLTLVTGALIAVGVLVVVLVGASNGGGGGGGDLAGYFQTLNTTQTDVSTQYSAIQSKYPQAFTDKQQTLDFLAESATTWTDAVDKLKAIEPPEAAASAHDGLVKAVGDVGAAFATLHTSAEAANDAAALEALKTDPSTAAFNDYSTACSAMQALADQNKITITLPC